MYGKVFASMYDGTLATRGPWQALVTFQQFIVLKNRAGIVDMTAEAISRRTTIPLEIINIGIAALEQEDSESRSAELNGRRIVRLDPNRAWGWQVVNHDKYNKIKSEEDRREYMAKYMADKRAEEKAALTGVNSVNSRLAQLTHIDVDKDVNVLKNKTKAHDAKKNGFDLPDWIPAMQWDAWIESRTKARKAPTAFAKRKAVAMLDDLRSQGHHPAAVLAQSAFNGWTGLFPIRDQK